MAGVLNDMKPDNKVRRPLNVGYTKHDTDRQEVAQAVKQASQESLVNRIIDWKKLYDIVDNKSKDFENYIQINDSFIQLYRQLIWRHQLKKLRELPKKHMNWIIQLMEMNKLTQASNQIITLYNETNLIKANNLNDVLLADFSVSNVIYLATLKVIVMQIILKTRTAERYTETLLECFAHDVRYFLKSGHVKVHALVKLILNFFTLTASYKPLFALKFLQYVDQYNLKFEDYIKNMDIATFQKQIMKLLRKDASVNCYVYLAKYYDSYLNSAKINPVDLNEYLLNDIISPKLGAEIKKQLTSQTFVADKINALLRPLLYQANLNKITARLCDDVIISINKNIKDMNDDALLHVLVRLSNIFMSYNDFKRSENVAAVLYNCFVLERKLCFLENAAIVNYKLFLLTADAPQHFKKFERLIGCCPDINVRKTLFSYVCNVFATFEDNTLQAIWEVTRRDLAACFRRMRLVKFEMFNFSSEPMLCLLYSGSQLSHQFSWSHLCQMVTDIVTSKTQPDFEIDVKISSLDSFSNYEVLIKSIYCLNCELNKSSCLKLQRIAGIYLEKWVKRETELKLADLEKSFLESLMPYLIQNEMYKTCVELCSDLKLIERYSKISASISYWLLESYVGLQLEPKVEILISQSTSLDTNLQLSLAEISMKNLYDLLCVRLTEIIWKKDINSFNKIIHGDLKKCRPNLFDIQNTSKMPVSEYLKVLMLNIKITRCASMLHAYHDNLYESLRECKRSLKICRILIKKETVLSAQYRFEVIFLLDDIFRRIISIYVHTGVFKDCAFFINEYQEVIGSLDNPTAMFNMWSCLCSYYQLLGKSELARSSLQKMNAAFNQIDGSANIDALAIFLFYNGELEKLNSSMSLFFGSDAGISDTVDYWLLRSCQKTSTKQTRKDFEAMACMNNAKVLYNKVRKQMDTDSFFRSMGESVMTVPACYECDISAVDLKRRHLQLGGIAPVRSLNDSPRPSSLTPRGKSLANSFDRKTAIDNLQTTNRFIQDADIGALKSYEIRELAALQSLTLSLFFNMSVKTKLENQLSQHFRLRDHPRSLSLRYEKAFSDMGTEIYDSFIPENIKVTNSEASGSSTDLDTIHSHFLNKWSHLSFNVVEIDVCQLTGDLLITRLDTLRGKHLHLRLPLNRHNSRDLSEEVLDFEAALAEMDQIITSNNLTASFEVTSAVSTKNQRKNWWDERYALNDRLKMLLAKIEDSWFCGFKGVFSTAIVDEQQFEVFKRGFQSILHTQLPSRKLSRQYDSFLKIDDMLIELFILLDVLSQPTETAVSMMEDLIYFIFDILLFHGEQNAYDEIDVNLMHVKFEELLQEYNAASSTKHQKLDHTFLILGNKCHSIPWESLSFLKSIPISRVPSMQMLDKLLTRYSELSPSIDISENLSFVLNPGNDLGRTETVFSSRFTTLASESNSKTFIGKPPTAEEFLHSVANSNLFVYVGHSAGEQYVRLKDLRKCNELAPSLLLGCSSAHLKYCGSFESSGTIYSYLLGGSPMVVGNLWDVTDKDTDKLSVTMFEKTGFFRTSFLSQCTDSSGTVKELPNVCEAISQSREGCNMKYLIGAAMIVYGLPMKFTRKTVAANA
ncbi:unnamed protein product [Kluyveromyces dobzhanskii CBS 2104]|uniref:separase n=1 Tax=Kluyveromyces dobzhanskii CBS 2104 TaxID=1427455 RepID=A0A0A8L729_9SACH|nr:unnamed protein product [Kluyveromyces dobzhanskii CBS 2104]